MFIHDQKRYKGVDRECSCFIWLDLLLACCQALEHSTAHIYEMPVPTGRGQGVGEAEGNRVGQPEIKFAG